MVVDVDKPYLRRDSHILFGSNLRSCDERSVTIVHIINTLSIERFEGQLERRKT